MFADLLLARLLTGMADDASKVTPTSSPLLLRCVATATRPQLSSRWRFFCVKLFTSYFHLVCVYVCDFASCQPWRFLPRGRTFNFCHVQRVNPGGLPRKSALQCVKVNYSWGQCHTELNWEIFLPARWKAEAPLSHANVTFTLNRCTSAA